MKPFTRAELSALTTQILDRGVTVENLAKAAKVQESVVIEIMKGQLRPSLEVRRSLAQALGVNLSRLD
jgi:ribosome-binding protein aMBF1 (putative translation factor)